jgi:hypothetical protein
MTTAEATERRSFHPVAFLLKAGAIAGAIGSITGVLFTFAPGLQTGGDASTTRVSGRIPGTKLHATLTVPNDAVSHMSYRDNLRELGVPLKYSTDDLGQKGIAINYRLNFPGYPKGTRFRIRYDLYRGQTFVRRQLQAIQMDVGHVRVQEPVHRAAEAGRRLPRRDQRLPPARALQRSGRPRVDVSVLDERLISLDRRPSAHEPRGLV